MRVNASGSGLNGRRALFCAEYLLDLNGKQAVIRAGYSPRGAEVTASRLLSDANVGSEIRARMERRMERTGIDSDWVLRRLVELADVDLAGLVNKGGSVKKLSEMPRDLKRLLAGIEVTEEFAGSGSKRAKIGYTKRVRLVDRLRVLELIGKHMGVGAFRENARVGHVQDLTQCILEGRRRAMESRSQHARAQSDAQTRAG